MLLVLVGLAAWITSPGILLAANNSVYHEPIAAAYFFTACFLALFERVAFAVDTGTAPQPSLPFVPTDQRIMTLGTADPLLLEQLFQYGRYLLIAASRPG